MVLLGIGNRMALVVWEEQILQIFNQIASGYILKCCRVFLTAPFIIILRDRLTLKNVQSYVLFHRYYRC